MPGVRRLRDPGRGPVVHARARRRAGAHRVRVGDRLQRPVHLLHGHLRVPRDPRARAGDRDRHRDGEPRAHRLGRDRRRRRAVDRRQPPDPRAPPQRQPEDPAVQQPDLRAHEGPVLADLRGRQGHEVDTVRVGRPPVRPGRARARRRRDVRRADDRQRPQAPDRGAAPGRRAPRRGVRRDLSELQRVQRRRVRPAAGQDPGRAQPDPAGARRADRVRRGHAVRPARGERATRDRGGRRYRPGARSSPTTCTGRRRSRSRSRTCRRGRPSRPASGCSARSSATTLRRGDPRADRQATRAARRRRSRTALLTAATPGPSEPPEDRPGYGGCRQPGSTTTAPPSAAPITSPAAKPAALPSAAGPDRRADRGAESRPEPASARSRAARSRGDPRVGWLEPCHRGRRDPLRPAGGPPTTSASTSTQRSSSAIGGRRTHARRGTTGSRASPSCSSTGEGSSGRPVPGDAGPDVDAAIVQRHRERRRVEPGDREADEVRHAVRRMPVDRGARAPSRRSDREGSRSAPMRAPPRRPSSRGRRSSAAAIPAIPGRFSDAGAPVALPVVPGERRARSPRRGARTARPHRGGRRRCVPTSLSRSTLQGADVDREAAGGLDRVRVERHAGRAGEPGGLADLLHRADLVVRVLDGREHRPRHADRGREAIEVEAAAAVTADRDERDAPWREPSRPPPATAGCSIALDDHGPSTRPAATPRPPERTDSVPPDVNTISSGCAPIASATERPRILEQRPRGAAGRRGSASGSPKASSAATHRLARRGHERGGAAGVEVQVAPSPSAQRMGPAAAPPQGVAGSRLAQEQVPVADPRDDAAGDRSDDPHPPVRVVVRRDGGSEPARRVHRRARSGWRPRRCRS